MLFGINTAPEEYQRRQTDGFSDLPSIAVIVNDHLVCGCGKRMEECKNNDNNLCGLLEIARRLGCSLIHKKAIKT